MEREDFKKWAAREYLRKLFPGWIDGDNEENYPIEAIKAKHDFIAGFEYADAHPKEREDAAFTITQDMRIKKEDEVLRLPPDMDGECISLCDTLNRLPGVETFESCCGHGERPFWVFFRCINLGSLSRLGRCVSRNYSDGNWEIVVDSCDGDPYGCFWLRTKDVLPKENLTGSINGLIESILYWFGDEFDEYFSTKQA